VLSTLEYHRGFGSRTQFVGENVVLSRQFVDGIVEFNRERTHDFVHMALNRVHVVGWNEIFPLAHFDSALLFEKPLEA